MIRDFILLEALQTYSVEESKQWLGRIVRFYRKPIAGYTPVDGSIIQEDPQEDSQFSNVELLTSQLSSSKMQASFLGLFGFNLEDRKKNSEQLASRYIQRLRIHNDDDVLKKVLANTAVVDKLEEWGFGIMQPAFMVVGLLVADDILYREGSSAKKGFGVHVDPGQIAATIAGVPPGLTNATSTPISLSHESIDSVSKSMTVKGRRVFAIEYRILQRRINFKLWNPISVQTTKLNLNGPQGDRTFSSASTTQVTKPAGDDSKEGTTGEDKNETEGKFIEDSLDEVIDEDDMAGKGLEEMTPAAQGRHSRLGDIPDCAV